MPPVGDKFGMVKGPQEETTASIKAVLRDLDRIELSLLILKLKSVCLGDRVQRRTSTWPVPVASPTGISR